MSVYLDVHRKGSQVAVVPAGPLGRVQAAAIGISHHSRITHHVTGN